MSENESTAIVSKPAIDMIDGIASPKTFEAVYRYAEVYAHSGLVPDHFKGNPAAIIVAWEYGTRLGWDRFQVLQDIYVIGGRPALYAQAMQALVVQDEVCEWFRSGVEGEGEKQFGWAETKRKGNPESDRRTFSIAQAKQAGYYQRNKNWQSDPEAQLIARAVSRLCRAVYPDLLRGLRSTEDLLDADLAPDRPAPSAPDPLTPGRHTLKAEPRRHVANQAPPEDDVIDVDAQEVPAVKEPEQVEVTLKGVEPDPEPTPPVSEPPFDNVGPTFDDCVNAAVQREEIDGQSEAAQFVNTYLRKVLKKGDRDATPEDYQGIIDKLASPKFKPGLYLV